MTIIQRHVNAGEGASSQSTTKRMKKKDLLSTFRENWIISEHPSRDIELLFVRFRSDFLPPCINWSFARELIMEMNEQGRNKYQLRR